MTLMSLHLFEADRALLPEALAERAQRLRVGAVRSPGCHCCKAVRQALGLCFTAARHGDLEWAGLLLGEAEHYADHGRHLVGCPQVTVVRPPARPSLSHGRVSGWELHEGPLVAATDASWKDGACGLGYVVSDGRWGMRGWKLGHQDPTGPCKVLVSELRAVALVLEEVEQDRPLLLLTDSLKALRLLRTWQRGDTSPMPHGYDLRPRRDGTPTLVRLAERVARRPGLRMEHVKGHSGHPLNETADSLASIARRRLTDRLDSRARAEGLVRAFLTDWHDHDGRRPLAA